MAAHMDKMGAKFERSLARRDETVFALSHVVPKGLFATLQTNDGDGILDERIWTVHRVGAVGMMQSLGGELKEMAFEIDAAPIPTKDFGGKPPTVTPKEGNFVPFVNGR